jgi:lysozyme
MRISPEGRALVEAFENCDRPVPGRPGFFTTYRDEVGVLTIGFGHTNLGSVAPAFRAGDVWTRAQCDAALDNDMSASGADVARIMSGVPLTQGEFDALLSFHFNTGDLGKSSIPAKLRRGDRDGAMATLLRYDHGKGVGVLRGLTRRRRAEKLLFEGSVAAALKLAGAHVGERGPDGADARPLPKASPRPPPSHPVDTGAGIVAALAAAWHALTHEASAVEVTIVAVIVVAALALVTKPKEA